MRFPMRFLASGLAAGLLISASAAQADSACARMKDAIGCACAVATGGTVFGRTWARGPDRSAFDACLATHGSSPLAGRPVTIRARL